MEWKGVRVKREGKLRPDLMVVIRLWTAHHQRLEKRLGQDGRRDNQPLLDPVLKLTSTPLS